MNEAPNFLVGGGSRNADQWKRHVVAWNDDHPDHLIADDQVPAAGAVAVWDTGGKNHVGYVDFVGADSKGTYVLTSESGFSNAAGQRAVYRPGGRGWPHHFLHPRDIGVTWFPSGTVLSVTDGESEQEYYEIVDGVKVAITADEVTELAAWDRLVPVLSDEISGLGTEIKDGSLLKVPDSAKISEVIGGARYEFSDWSEYLAVDPSGSAYTVVPARIRGMFDGSSDAVPTGERVTAGLLRNPVNGFIYEVRTNPETQVLEKVQLTGAEWARRGFPSYIDAPYVFINRVPDGAPMWPTFVRDSEGTTYQAVGGTKFEVTPEELVELRNPDSIQVTDAILAQIPFGVPDGQALLKSPLGPEIFQLAGTHRIQLVPSEYELLGSPGFIEVPLRLITSQTTADTPDDVEYLRDPNPATQTVFHIVDGKKVRLTPKQYGDLGVAGQCTTKLVADGVPCFYNAVARFFEDIPETPPSGPLFVRREGTSTIYQVLGGQRYELTLAEYNALGNPEYADYPWSVISQIPSDGAPAGYTLFRAAGTVFIYQVRDGKAYLLTPAQYGALPVQDFVTVPMGWLGGVRIGFGAAEAPVYFRRAGTPYIYVVLSGQKYQLNYAEYSALLPLTFTDIPGASLDLLPDGAPLDIPLLKDPVTSAVFAVDGIAKTRLTPEQVAALGSTPVVKAPLGFINRIPDGVPTGPAFYRATGTSLIYQVLDSQKYLLTQAEYSALGNPAFFDLAPNVISQLGDGPPGDSTLLQAAGTPFIFQVRDGSAYLLTSAQYAALPSQTYLRAPLGFINRYPHGISLDSAFVREAGASTIYQVLDGQKLVLTLAEYTSLGSPIFYDEPASELAEIPNAEEGYGPAGVPLLRDPVTGVIYQVNYGEKFRLTQSEYNALIADTTLPERERKYVDAPFRFINMIPDGTPYGPTFVRNATTGGIYQVLGGAKHFLPSTEYAALGSPSWINTPVEVIDAIDAESPWEDGLLSEEDAASGVFMKDAVTGAVYQVLGGAKHLVSPSDLVALGPIAPVRAPIGFINEADGTVPEGTILVRSVGTDDFYLIEHGAKRPIDLNEEPQAPGTLTYGFAPGWLAAIPDAT